MTEKIKSTFKIVNEGVHSIVNYYIRSNTNKSYLKSGQILTTLQKSLPDVPVKINLYNTGILNINRISIK